MTIQNFSYVTILFIIHGYIRDKESYKLLTFLTGQEIDSNDSEKMKEIIKKCKSSLLDLFPEFNNIHVKQAFEDLEQKLNNDNLCAEMVIREWLNTHNTIFRVYGESLPIKPIKNNLSTLKNSKKERVSDYKFS